MSSVTDELMASHLYLAEKHARFSEEQGVPMRNTLLKEFAAGRLLRTGRASEARQIFRELLRDDPSPRWIAKLVGATLPGSLPVRVSDWRFRRGVPADWNWSVELWLTQLMRLEVRDQTSSN
jgi:hypothetical protein